MFLRSLLVLSCLINFVKLEHYLPILFWHSAGESFSSDETKLYVKFLQSQLNNDVYIKTVSMNDIAALDFVRSLTMHPFDQIKRVCDSIKSDPRFAKGYNGVGLSQGALLMRGLAQTCPNPPMQNLISLGGPQQGVHRFPRCQEKFGFMCAPIQAAINSLIYSWPIQSTITPASYWHDIDEQRYRRGSTFLAVINNENDYNANYVNNLHNLKRTILVKYVTDGAIVPNSSSWLGYYDGKTEYTMEETFCFKNDRLDLRKLKESGKLVLLLSPRDHLEIDPNWFIQNLIPYLKDVN